MVQEPRIRTEDIDAFIAGRLDEIKPEILAEVKDIVSRLNKPAATPPVAPEIHDEDQES